MKSTGLIGICILFLSMLPKEGFSQIEPTIFYGTVTESSVSLTLNIGESSVYGYNFDIYRDGSPIHNVSGSFSGQIDFEDTSLDPDSTYDYYGVVTLLDSFFGDSTSQTTTTLQVTTLPKPSTVTNVQADGSTYGQITVTWNQNSESDFNYYNLYRETSSTSSPGNVLTTIYTNTTTNYIDNTAADGTTYFYYVTVVNNELVEGDISNEASTTSLYALNYITNSNSSFTGLWSPLKPIDYDNDGDLDLFYTGITSSSAISSRIYDNNGSGQFTENTSHGLPAIHSYVSSYFVWGDYDNDGDQDIVLAGDDASIASGTRRVYTYINNGDGTFSEKTNSALIPAWFPAMALGDYDNDGDLDLFITGQTGAGVEQAILYDNDGDGNFSVNSQSFTGVETGAVEWVDFDNDGDLDLTYFGNDIIAGGNGSFFYINNGDGTFTEETVNTPLKELRFSALSWADFNNDGYYDVFISGFDDVNSPSKVNQLYKNDGDGTFTLFADAVSGIVNQTTIDWGDYDNDGDLDLLLSGYDQDGGTYSAKVFENSGSGGGYTFSENTTLPEIEAYSSAWIDIDGDTDLDAVFGISDGVNPFEIQLFENHLNNTSTTVAPTNLSWTETADSVTFSWDAVTDPDGGPVSYNLYLTEESSSNNEGVPSNSNNSTGYRRVLEHGNMRLNTSFTISKDSLQTAVYEWGVQSVDATWQGSSFTTGSNYSITVAKPANFSALFTSSLNKVDLSWDANTELGVQYEVYRIDEATSSTTKISTTSSTSLSDYPPAPDNYTYYLKAVVAVGIESVSSDSTIIAAYPDATIPSALDTTSTSISEVVLEWSQTGNEPATGENYSFELNKFEVYRDSGAIGTGTILLASPTSPSFTDNSVAAGATYYYYVQAIESVTPDTSGFSDTLLVTLSLPAAPTAPTNLSVTKNLYNNVSLSWDASTSEVNVEYEVYRTDVGLIGTTTTTNYTDGTVAASTAYSYSVTPKDEFDQTGVSSGSINVTTPSFIIVGGGTSGIPAVNGYDAEAADVDNDGDLDLVIAGYNGSSIGAVYFNNGAGAYSTSTALPASYWDRYSRFDLSDYDGDGDLDIALTSNNNSTLYVLDNNGSGTFSYSGISFTGSGLGDPSWGDVDNDGDMDLFISGGTSSLYINNNGVFANSGQSFNTTSSTKSQWGDYNNDGYLDLLFVGNSPSNTALYVNDGSGNLSNSGLSIISSYNGSNAIWRDINNDGWLDFLITTQNDGIYIYQNNGSGSFSESQLSTSQTMNNPQISMEDFDHDGDSDVFVFGLTGTGTAAVYKSFYFENEGNITFTEIELGIPGFNFAPFLLNGDFDDDGDLEFGITGGIINYSPFSIGYAITFFDNISSSTLTNTVPSSPGGLNTSLNGAKRTLSWNSSTDAEGAIGSYNVFVQETSSSALQAPANSDTTTGYRMTVESGNTGLNTSYIIDESRLPSGTYSWGVQAIDGSYLGSAFTKGASFTLANAIPTTPTGLTISNVEYTTLDLTWNSINESDAFYNIYRETASTATPTNLVATSTDTTYSESVLTDGTTYYYYIQAEDLAGQQSSFSTEASASTLLLLLKEETGISLIDLSESAVAWGDYDNDGDLDLAISGNAGYAYLTVLYRNDGVSGFTNSGNSLVGAIHGSLAWGDYDNDGDLDLVVTGDANFGLGRITKIYTNNGNGSLSDSGISLTGVQESSVSWGDYDNDGDLDLVISGLTGATSTTGITKLYENTGDGNFSENTNVSLTDVGYSAVAWADYDNDGDLDLVISGLDSSDNPVTTLYTNQADGSFSSSTPFANVSRSSLEWADIDDDGDLDLLLSGFNASSNPVTILYENGENNVFTDSGQSLTDVLSGSSTFGDYDNDGDLDLVFSGALDVSATSVTTILYENDGSGSFSDSQIPLEAAYEGGVSFGDYDADGDLDLAINGNSSTKVYKNYSTTANNNPTIPTNLMGSITVDTVSISWDAATDSEGSPLNYNVFMIDEDASEILATSMSDTSNGYRRVTYMGNAGLNTSHRFITSKTKKPLLIGVQAIDGTNGASDFTTILLFSGEFIQANRLEIMAYEDLIYTFDINALELISGFSDSTFAVSQTDALSGIFFKDVNNNKVFDAITDVLIQNVSSTTFSPSGGDTLRYISNDPRIESTSLIFSTTQYTDTLGIDITTVKGNPQIEGTNNESGWYLLSNPFTTTIGELLGNVWTQGAPNSDSPAGSSTLYTFSQDSSKYVAVTTDLDTTKLDVGEGLLVYLFEDDDLGDGESDIDGGWPKTLSNYGSPFGEQISVDIKNVDHDGFNGTSGSEGFALMGNPYGWSISADSVIATLKREDPLANSYIYRWDAASKLFYLTTSGTIAPYESYFIRTITSGTTATLTFDYNDYVEVVDEGGELEEGDDPNKLTASKEPVLVAFNLISDEHETTSSSFLRFDDEASPEIDPFDGYYLGSYASEYANLYTKIGDQNLAINNIPSSLDEIVEYPIYLDASISGDFELNWNKEELPKNWKFSLEDIATGLVFDLHNEDKFSFNTDQRAKITTSNTNEQDSEESEESSEKDSENEDIEKGTIESNKSSIQNLMNTTEKASKAKSLDSISGSTQAPLFTLTINPLTNTSNEGGLGIPKEVELDQNYPNPFNPTSVIRFGVPNTAEVQLEVFDILGRKVATLLNNETKQPGRYNVQFNARNLSSGMYIYRLVIGDKVLTKKMTLIK